MPPPAPEKKARYNCYYKSEWEQTFKWLKPVLNEPTKASCVFCKKEFAVNNQGIHQVKQHNESEGHKLKARTHAHNTLLDAFCKSNKSTSEDNKLAAQELTFVYHNVKHNLSYRSLDCNIKLLKHVFPDATKKITLGKTKAEALVINVLGTKAVDKVIQHLTSSTVFYAIQMDASNVKNRKFFPITVQFFDKDKGIVNRIINFLENPDETAIGMFRTVDDTIKKLKLSYENISALSADNCNANFGSKQSLYTELKEKSPSLVKANCNAHIVHNTVRHVIDQLDYDVENLILKIYAHFSLSAKRRETLKEFSEFTEVEYIELSRHVTTRWLSLNKSIETILKLWKPLLSYFRSIKNCPTQIQKLLYIKENEYEDVPENEIPEIYLMFLNSFLKLFEDVVLSLEKNDVSIIEVFNIFDTLRDKINQRLEEQFFGFLVMQKLKNLDAYRAETIKKDLLNAYDVANAYLLQWFDFSENGLPYVISKLKLDHEISFSELTACIDKISNDNLKGQLDMDKLFDELSDLHKIFNVCKKQEYFLSLSESEKWKHIFEKTNNLPSNLENLIKIISFIFSIPCTTAYVERIFSIMSNKWTDTRNRASTQLIKSELCITLNFDKSCNEFYNYALTDQKLLTESKNKLKYDMQRE